MDKQNAMHLRTGTEGPHYDPYHYDELSVSTQRGYVTVHNGLAMWCEVKTLVGRTRAEGEEDAATLFERVVGVTPATALRAYQKLKYELPYRRHAAVCGERAFESTSGYPGETFTICPACGVILEYHFNRSEIE